MALRTAAAFVVGFTLLSGCTADSVTGTVHQRRTVTHIGADASALARPDAGTAPPVFADAGASGAQTARDEAGVNGVPARSSLSRDGGSDANAPAGHDLGPSPTGHADAGDRADAAPPSRSPLDTIPGSNRQAPRPPQNVVTIDGDAQRTGWYSNQPLLDPGIVTSSSFGRLFKTALTLSPGEQVFTQPLVFDGKVLVATEANDFYTLDATTGAVLAAKNFGAPWHPADIGCSDLSPIVGITGTPVIDATTRTAFFFTKAYRDPTGGADRANVMWNAHAVDVDTLDERPNFPVEIRGTASNDSNVTFSAFPEMQRTGLLLMDGVVYAGFGGHCDLDDYHGWLVGVGEDGSLRVMFATEAGPGSVRGAGIWQAGAGLMSDASGNIYFTTGNGYSNSMIAPTAGATPPNALDESVVRVAVQPDGSLSAVDFFAPYDVSYLDDADMDFGSGAVVALPDDTFGTTEHPHLAVACGKEGILYLLDRDNLGGFKQGIGGGDAALSQVYTAGGMWSSPAVWSGNGGMAYVVPAFGQLQSFQYGPGPNGVPALSYVASSAEYTGYSTGSPIITSNGTQAGSALVWITYTTGSYGSGALRAYDAIPDATGHLTLRYEDAYGTHAKFSRPGVGTGRLYVGTADGNVVGYGSPVKSPLFARPLDFGTVVAGSTASNNVAIRARIATTVSSISTSNPAFAAASVTPPLPAHLNAGDALTVSASFTPGAAQPYVGALLLTTDAGPASVSLHGVARSRGPVLSVASQGVSFGGLPVNASRSANVLLTNSGSQALTWSEIDLPEPPFAVMGAPSPGGRVLPGQSITVTITFTPSEVGTFGDNLVLFSDGGSATVLLSGTSTYSGQLVIDPSSLDFATVATGQTASQTFTIRNTGNANVTITKSKPPALGVFTAQSELDEGTVVGPGASVVETIAFSPTADGSYSDEWIIGASDGGGARAVSFTGIAATAPSSDQN